MICLHHYHRHQAAARNPAWRIKMYRERLVERFLSENEIATAADAITAAERDGKIGPHAAAGLRLALFSGARSGEITAAQWSHVDWQRKLIRLPNSKTNEHVPFRQPGQRCMLHGRILS